MIGLVVVYLIDRSDFPLWCLWMHRQPRGYDHCTRCFRRLSLTHNLGVEQ